MANHRHFSKKNKTVDLLVINEGNHVDELT